MAKVSHHQMLRNPSDGSPANVAKAVYYPSSSHRTSPSPEKTKKSWGQRLKLGKSERSSFDSSLDFEQHNVPPIPPLHPNVYQQTMKYTESWVYGTVRGIPVPRHDMPIFCPAEVAVVICSCPEYLHGTKKEVKKASVCKKCKGSRLPLAPLGGTLRLAASPHTFIPTPIKNNSNTVKLTSSSKKSRPSILGNQNDPYDLMRRSRLLSPELKPVKNKNRAKSTSPTRGRSRKRSPSPKNSIKINNRSLSANRSNSNKPFKELWIEPDEPPVDINLDHNVRKSILKCDINPYDLMTVNSANSLTNTNNEFMPTNDDDFDLSVHSQKYENLLDQLYASRYNPNLQSLKAVAGQRIKFFDENEIKSSTEEDYIYDPVDVGQNDVENQENNPSPVRPPRLKNIKIESPKEEEEVNLRTPNIKSILKRPSSQSSSEEGSKQSQEIPKQTTEQKPLNNLLALKLSKINFDSLPNGKMMSISARNFKNSKCDKEKRSSGTQFYLPTPNSTLNTRKKVHFLVENDVIKDDKLFAQYLLRGNVTCKMENLSEKRENYEIIEQSYNHTKTKDAHEHHHFHGNEKDKSKIVEQDLAVSSANNGILCRSVSERKLPENDMIYDIPQFIDTMALRSKQQRPDFRVIFIDEPQLMRGRPKEPPPPPPPAKIQPNVPQKDEIDDSNIYEDFCYNSQHNMIESEKTVVKVVTPTFNKDLSAVHRLEIKHEDDNVNYDQLGLKTSILINGDDCYSTVNVNDNANTPIYQSSVVVNDDNVLSPAILQTSSNTVTISVGAFESSIQKRTPNEEMIYQNNKKNSTFLINSKTSIIPIGGIEEVKFFDEKSRNLNKTLINLDDGKNVKMQIVPIDIDDIEENSKETEDEDDEDDDGSKSCDTVVFRRNNENCNRNSFILKLLEDPTLGHLADRLDYDLVTKLIENSLIRLKDSRSTLDMSGTKDEDDVSKMIETSLKKVKEERAKIEKSSNDQKDSKRSSISSGNSYGSASYELMDFDNGADLSDCYQSCSSDLTTDDDTNSTRSKFYQMLVDATLSEIEISTNLDEDHHYESIRINSDPIYEEISEIPPPLPLSPPPLLDDPELDKKSCSRSIFEGASKYDILSYLVDAKERGIVQEEQYLYNLSNSSDIILEEEEELGNISELRHHQRQISDISSRLSHISGISDSSEDAVSTTILMSTANRRASAEVERNDSGVGSETSKSSRSKWQHPNAAILDKISPIHLCEDCDGPVETQITESGVMYAPLVCRKCGKKRAERKEIITEIVETEEKYGRDLQIILEEFYQPMLVAGLLSQEQLSTIFLNAEELLENNQFLAEKMRDALDIANEQGDDDLLTVNIGKLFLESAPMLHAFENYCVRQGAASLLLANLEKEKELLRIFLRVSQMENTVLRRMNLNSFLMVPVQRVTKYPLLLARLFKVTPHHLEGREQLKQAQEKIELHLNHMNREAKDVPTKLWRRIASSGPGRRLSCEIDMINIKLRKMAIDVLEWNTEEVRFSIEGRLLFTQPNDGNWKKSRTIKLTAINALLVTNGKPTTNYKGDRLALEPLNFPRQTGIREATLLLVREKNGRYTLLREPLYLDRCIVCTESDWEDYFEVQEVSSKESFIFKAEDGGKTKQWYTQLQYHSQGMGTWRKRRNALANIMINGMMTRT